MTLVCANYDHSQWLVARASEKGCAKPRAQSLDFTSLTAYPCVVREGLLFWTKLAMTQNYTYPDQTPPWVASHGIAMRHEGLRHVFGQLLPLSPMKFQALLNSFRSISRSLSRVNTGGTARRRGSVLRAHGVQNGAFSSGADWSFWINCTPLPMLIHCANVSSPLWLISRTQGAP